MSSLQKPYSGSWQIVYGWIYGNRYRSFNDWKSAIVTWKYVISQYCHVGHIKVSNTASPPLLLLVQIAPPQGRGRPLCNAWHFFAWIVKQKMTSHAVKKRAERQNKIWMWHKSSSLVNPQYFVIGRMSLTFYMVTINNISSSSARYRFFEEQTIIYSKTRCFNSNILFS